MNKTENTAFEASGRFAMFSAYRNLQFRGANMQLRHFFKFIEHARRFNLCFTIFCLLI